MVSGHLCVELTDSSIERDISVLLVHVVVGSSGLISQDNAEGLDVVGSSLKDLVDGQDLSLSSFGLQLTTEMVPELGLGDDFVSGEESDGIDFGVGVLVGGQLSSEHEVLSDLNARQRCTFIWSEGSVGSCAPF